MLFHSKLLAGATASIGMESTSEGRALEKEQKVSHEISQHTEETLHQVFNSLDANHNGRLEVPELKVRSPWSTTGSLCRVHPHDWRCAWVSINTEHIHGGSCRKR